MQVNRKQLLARLEAINPGLGHEKDNIDQSTCYVLRGGRAFTFNDEVSCSVPVPIEGIEGAVPAKPLTDLLRKLTADEVEVTAENGEFRVRQGKQRRSGIRMEVKIELPVEAVEQPDEWAELPEGFADAVDIVRRCASRDEGDGRLASVHVHPDRLEACDNFQVARWPISVPVGKPCLVRGESVRHVVGRGMTEMAMTESWLHFRAPDGLTLSCRRVLEEYPSLDGILDVEGAAMALPKELAEAAAKAAIFSSEEGINDNVLVELRPGKLRIRGEGPSGWYEERRSVEYSGKPVSFLIDPGMLIELVGRASEGILGVGRLKVETDKWTYVACLGQAEEEK